MFEAASSASPSSFSSPLSGIFLFLLLAAYTRGAPNGQYIAWLQEGLTAHFDQGKSKLLATIALTLALFWKIFNFHFLAVVFNDFQ